MAAASAVAKILHEEHFWTVVLVNGVETRVSEAERGNPFDPDQPSDRAMMEQLVELFGAMIRHHAFEERILFPVLRKGANANLVQLFEDEHKTMGPFAERLRAITKEILEHGITPQRLSDFTTTVPRFSEYAMMHIQKEEIALIQKLNTLIDTETDKALAAKYMDLKAAGNRQAAG